jgi:hypothetical protein
VWEIARFPEKVRALQNLFQRAGAVGLYPGRPQGELVTIHFYASRRRDTVEPRKII